MTHPGGDTLTVLMLVIILSLCLYAIVEVLLQRRIK